MHLPFSMAASNLFWGYGIGASLLGIAGICIGQTTRTRSHHLLRQVEREKKRSVLP